jgi:enoyl-CoA hydratase/carnithine racemase
MTATSQVDYNVENYIATVSLNRPPVNALTRQLIVDIVAALRQAGEDDDVRVVILTSSLEKVFCAGLDLEIVSAGDAQVMRGFLEKLYMELYDVQYRLGKPSIAAVSGAARAGGMTLAVSCDMIVAADSASFGYPEIDVGIIPALHFVHLPRQIGRNRAFELLFTGESFKAQEALDLGIVNHLVPKNQVMEKAQQIAAKFARKSPLVMRMGRNAWMRANDLDYRRNIENVEETMCTIVETEESKEGLRAFLEKRPPNWNKP